jgi:hypothetical protein
MQKISQVAPDKYSFILKTAAEIRESPFRDEIVGHLDALIKKANMMAPPGMGARFGNALAGVGAMAATGIAYSLAGDMYDAAKRGITKSRDYKAMLKENPDLHEMPAKDIQKAFSTLHRFNPEFAGDPMVAGSFVRQRANLPGGEFDAQMLTSLVGSHKNLADTKKLPVPGKLPWDSHDDKQSKSLQNQKMRQELSQNAEIHPPRLLKAQQDADPEFQRSVREADPHQQKLWETQTALSKTQLREKQLEIKSKLDELINNRAEWFERGPKRPRR